MSPQTRRPVFELLRLTASPIGDALSIIDVEGRFGQSGRFARRPALVVEPGDDRARFELAPVHVDAHGDHWRAAYAVPADALEGGRLALAVRGALYELPEPTVLGGAAGPRDRAVHLAREANALRRRVEHLEAQVQEADARAQAAQERAQAEAAGVEVLREELAEERRRATAAIHELQARLDEARAEGPPAPDDEEDDLDLDPDSEPEAEDATRPIPVRAGPVIERRVRQPISHPYAPGPERWLAVVAILLVVAIVIAVMAGLRG